MKTKKMKVILSLLGTMVLPYIVAAGVSERSEIEELLHEESSTLLFDKYAFLSELFAWSVLPPNFNDAQSIETFTFWLQSAIKTMKAIDKILDQSAIEFGKPGCVLLQDAQKVLDDLWNFVLLYTGPKLNENMPSALYEAVGKFALIHSQSALFIQSLQAKRHYVEMRCTPSLTKETLSKFMDTRQCITQKQKYQMLSKLYATQITAEQMIYQEFETLRNKTLVSVELIGEFITHILNSQAPYNRDYPKFKSTKVRGEAQPTRDSLSDVPEQGTNPKVKRQKRHDTSEVLHLYTYSNLLNCVFSNVILDKQKIIHEKLVEWKNSIQNDQELQLSEMTSFFQTHILPFMKNVETFICLWKVQAEFYAPALQSLDEIRDFIRKAVDKIPIDFFQGLTFLEYGIQYRRVFLRQQFRALEQNPSMEHLMLFIDKNSYFESRNVFLISIYQAFLQLQTMEKPKTATSMLEENLETFRRQKHIASIEDIEQFFMVNENYWHMWAEPGVNEGPMSMNEAMGLLGFDALKGSSYLPSLMSIHSPINLLK